MSRNEGRIGVGDELAVDASEILAELKADCSETHRIAVARYLSGSEGWKEALEMLGGAFAPPARERDG